MSKCTANLKDEVTEEDMELPIFDMGAISKATNNFSSSNKIGEGGFGPVYKVARHHSNCFNI